MKRGGCGGHLHSNRTGIGGRAFPTNMTLHTRTVLRHFKNIHTLGKKSVAGERGQSSVLAWGRRISYIYIGVRGNIGRRRSTVLENIGHPGTALNIHPRYPWDSGHCTQSGQLHDTLSGQLHYTVQLIEMQHL